MFWVYFLLTRIPTSDKYCGSIPFFSLVQDVKIVMHRIQNHEKLKPS